MRNTIFALVALAPATGCLDASEGQAKWDRSEDAVIIDATSCCGFVASTAAASYTPDARVWGDGRIVWTEYAQGGGRDVLEGQLSEGQLTHLIELIEYSEFFDWDDEYIDESTPEDVPPVRLTVTTLEDSHTVLDHGFSGPHMFRAIFKQLSIGAGADGEDYALDTAFLQTTPVDNLMVDDSPSWDSDASGLDLAVAGEGAWIDGAALEAAWDVVNDNPWYPVANQGGHDFTLALQIPELTLEPINE